MNAPTYTRADLEMVAFLASRKPWTVQKEKYRMSLEEASVAEYDRITEENMKFIRGQQAATTARRAA